MSKISLQAAIQAAIDACSQAGGGMVYVPAGQFEMGLSDAQVDRVLRVCSEAGDDRERKEFRDTQPAHTVTLDAPDYKFTSSLILQEI